MQFHRRDFRIGRSYIMVVPLCALMLLGGERPDQGPPCRHTHEDLDAVLWMETSAEYYDCATQAYVSAKVALVKALGDPTDTAAVEQTNPFDKLPPAVILDVDETVLDNSPFQAWLVKYSQSYQPSVWNDWVNASRSKAIPGSVEFTQFAKGKHVAVFFVTNRDVALKNATVKNLRDCGFPVEPDSANVLCTNETQPGTNTKWTSDKNERRRFLCAKYRIVLQCGDQLGDFISSDTLGTADRRQLAKLHASFWGEKWIALPNPTYGRWQSSLTDSPIRLSDAQSLEREYGAMNVWNHPAPTR